MHTLTPSKWRSAIVAGLILGVMGCGGGTSPTAPVSPIPTPTATPSSGPPPTGMALVDSVCRSVGYGTPKVGCDTIEDVTILPSLEAAIDQVVAANPGNFDLNNQQGPGGFFVYDRPLFIEQVQVALAGRSVCSVALEGGTSIKAKSHNELDETYAILNSKGHIRRGFGAYRQSCIPSSFPLSPDDQFSYVRVAFFGFQCPEGVPTQPPAAGEVPLVCSGIVTATPKDANGVNTPPALHGNDVSWKLRSGDAYVSAYPALDGNIFNYIIQARDVGSFSLCATVGGKEGCLNGRVTQYP